MISLLGVALNIVGPVLAIVAVAVLVDRRFAPDPKVLSRLVLYVFSPCLVVDSLAHSDLRAAEIWQIAAVAALCSAAMLMIGWIVGRLLHFDEALTSAFLLSVSLINAGNYGLPLNEFAFGKAGLQRAVIFYIVTAVWTNSVGVYLASRGSGDGRRALLNVLTMPVLYASLLGLLLNITQISLPLPLQRTLSLLSQATVPCMLLILGLRLSRTSLKGKLAPLLLSATIRLVLAPLITIPLVGLLGVSGIARQVCIIQAAMPSAVMSSVLATEFGSDAGFASSSILFSTVVSIATLSILLWLVM